MHNSICLFVVCLALVLCGSVRAAPPRGTETDVSFDRWTVTGPIFTHGRKGAFDEIAVKDASLVYFNGKYHLFYTDIYRMKSSGEYFALLEGAYRLAEGKKNRWDARNRFMFARVADSLAGPWRRFETDANEFFGAAANLYNEDGSRCRYDQVSHPEVIRAGYDQKVEIDGRRFRIIFQAFDADGMADDFNYDDLPWELAVMENK